MMQAMPQTNLALIIHDGSLRSTHCIPQSNGYPAGALRGAPVALPLQRVREEPRGREAYRGPVALPYATGEQYVDRLSGEPARLPRTSHACLSQQRMGGYPLLCNLQRVDSRSVHE